jgi:hypothetical protein
VFLRDRCKFYALEELWGDADITSKPSLHNCAGPINAGEGSPNPNICWRGGRACEAMSDLTSYFHVDKKSHKKKRSPQCPRPTSPPGMQLWAGLLLFLVGGDVGEQQLTHQNQPAKAGVMLNGECAKSPSSTRRRGGSPSPGGPAQTEYACELTRRTPFGTATGAQFYFPHRGTPRRFR